MIIKANVRSRPGRFADCCIENRFIEEIDSQRLIELEKSIVIDLNRFDSIANRLPFGSN